MKTWTNLMLATLAFLVIAKLVASTYRKKAKQSAEKVWSFTDDYLLSEYSMQALIGIIATILGVTLGLHLSDVEARRHNIDSINHLFCTAYNDIEKKFAENDLFFSKSENESYSFRDYIVKRPAAIDYLLDNELSRQLIDQEIYIQLLDIRENLNLHLDKAARKGSPTESDKELLNLYYQYLKRTIYLAFLDINQGNTKDDIRILARTNSIWFLTKLGVINGLDEQEAFDASALLYMETYPERLTQDGNKSDLELGDMDYPNWLFLKD